MSAYFLKHHPISVKLSKESLAIFISQDYKIIVTTFYLKVVKNHYISTQV
ncbi:hypothetical protein F985_03985 [Acinetobacter seifertii]|uniref:Uncharacterized protein n=1 Tax=Acinetobacter seifertii TaxID=1530123 RepID=N8S4Y4_9GAMM|nr:hypothetical protein F985_03985 [Acinetobacter seifertii]